MPVPTPHSEAVNLGLLVEKMNREVVDALFFERFTNEVIREGLADMEKTPDPAPVKRYTDFQTKGMDHMLIPVEKPYTDGPFYGDAIVTGHGEKDDWDYTRLYINQIQKPIEGPGRTSEQRVKTLNIVQRERPKLTTWFARQREIQLVSSFYELFSRNITAGVASSGLAKTIRYHPNTYVAGQGLVTWSGTVATHRNSIGAALQGLTDTPSDHFTAANLEKMRAAVQTIPLEPVEVEGKLCYLVLAHHNQILQLRESQGFKDEMNSAFQGAGRGHPYVAAAEHYFANFLIYERRFSAWGVSETDAGGGSFTLTFGVTNPLTGLDTFNKKSAIIFGMNSILEGVASGITIDEQAQNINNYKELAARQIVGWGRNDFYDVDIDGASTPSTGKNQSSALFFSYSPAPFA